MTDLGSERVARTYGFSLHAGVNCEGHQKRKGAGRYGPSDCLTCANASKNGLR